MHPLDTTKRRVLLTKSRRPMSQAEAPLQVVSALVHSTLHPADPGLRRLVTVDLQDLDVRLFLHLLVLVAYHLV